MHCGILIDKNAHVNGVQSFFYSEKEAHSFSPFGLARFP